MTIYRASFLYLLAAPLVFFTAVYAASINLIGLPLVIGLYLAIGLLLLRCPKCRASTWLSDGWQPAKPPSSCHTCNLDFKQTKFGRP